MFTNNCARLGSEKKKRICTFSILTLSSNIAWHMWPRNCCTPNWQRNPSTLSEANKRCSAQSRASFKTVFKRDAFVPVLCAAWKRGCCSPRWGFVLSLCTSSSTHSSRHTRTQTLTTNWLRLKYPLFFLSLETKMQTHCAETMAVLVNQSAAAWMHNSHMQLWSV